VIAAEAVGIGLGQVVVVDPLGGVGSRTEMSIALVEVGPSHRHPLRCRGAPPVEPAGADDSAADDSDAEGAGGEELSAESSEPHATSAIAAVTTMVTVRVRVPIAVTVVRAP
jgi:hypothetical protein